MKTLHHIIKTKLILVALLFVSSVIIATTISVQLHTDIETPNKEINHGTDDKSSTVSHKSSANTNSPFFAASINNVNPRSGTVAGGTPVTISGSGFTPPNAIYTVKFNGVSATSVVRVSNTVITAVTPAHLPGTVSVTVGINGDETRVENLFTYVCDDPSNIVFIESIGTIPPGPPVSIASHESANGFDNDNFTMSGSGEIRGAPVSTGYPGASDGAHVFLSNVAGRNFRIDGIDASAYATLQLSFGLFKTTAASDGSDLLVEVSSDGINFTPLGFTPLPTGANSTGWHYRIATGTIPSSSTLSIRFTQNGSTTQYRIDDIRLISSPPITSQPSGIVGCPGSPSTFNVTAIGNGLTYQWRKDGTDINGAIASSYTIQAVTPNDAGTYDVVITESCSRLSTISNPAILIIDNIPPVITATGSTLNLGCNPSAAAIGGALGSASATDNCGIQTFTRADGPVVSSGCNRSQTRTFRATDVAGNTATTARTATWISDLTPPAFIGSYGSINLGCNPSATSITAALDGATASDACGPLTILSVDGPVISTGCNRSQSRTFIARDACANTSSVSRTVTWIADLTPPVFIGSYASVDLGCSPSATAINAALGTAAASDACNPVTLLSADGPVTSSGCNRSQSRIFSATDACGNTSSVSRTVSWRLDLTPPVLDVSSGTVDIGCNPSPAAIAAALGGATASDACSAPTLTFSTGPVISNGCNRAQTRTFTASDACGNTASASRTITWVADLTPPQFIDPPPVNIFLCNPSFIDILFYLGTATATDACGTTVVTYLDLMVTFGCNTFHTRTFTATDRCGNVSNLTRTVVAISDLTPPVLTISGSSTNLGCNPAVTTINAALGTATASDDCGSPFLTTTTGQVISNGCNRSQTRTFFASDICGNLSSASRTVTWIADVTPPAFIGSYAPVNLGCNPSPAEITAALDGATASDACGAPTLTFSTGPVISDDCDRSQTRTFTAIDACGNISTIARTVFWIADSAPLLVISGGSLNLGCNPSAASITGALGTATAFDACGSLTLTTTDGAIVSNGCNRSQTRTFMALDGCGNFASASRTATWTADITPPVFIGSYGSVNLGCNPSPAEITAALDGATASDACGAPTLTLSDSPVISNGCSRVQTRTFTAIDGCGNISTVARTVFWIADSPPLLAISGGSLNLGCNPSAASIAGALGTATASDACASLTLTTTDGAIVSNGCNRSQTRTFTALDGCGNFASASRTATWTADITPPVFIGSYASINLGCDPSPADITVALDGATASDACGAPTLTRSDGPVISNGCNRVQTRTFTAIDGCGNISTVARTVFWIADNPPLLVISGGSMNLGCNPAAFSITAALGTATASDACGSLTLTTTDGAIVSNGCNRSQTRTFIALDGCGNFASASRTATWVADITPPAFIGDYSTVSLGGDPSPADISAALNGATASDACGAPILSYSDGPVISNRCDRSQTRTFTAIDGCGNFATISRTVTWLCVQTRVITTYTKRNDKLSPFDVKAIPNPTEHQFILYVVNGSSEKVTVIVYDAVGRKLKKIERGDASGAIKFGEDLKVGAYIVEVRQGNNRKTLKLIKQ